MKERTLVLLLLLFVVLCAYAGNDLTLTYRQLEGSRSLMFQLNSTFVSYCLQVRQDRETGLFTLEAPPFLLANIDDRVRIGEIQDSGIFSLMLNPMQHDSDITGFVPSGNIKKIRNPSVKPTLSGMALRFDHVDLISLSPIFNPDSPYGFGAIGGNRNFFAGLLLATQNEMRIASAAEHYQVNWKQLGIGRHMAFSIVGAGAVARLDTDGTETLSGVVFLQNAWDAFLGGGSTVGWDLGYRNQLADVCVRRRLGGLGVKLKSLGDSDKPVDSFSIEAFVRSDSDARLGMGFRYSSDTFERPVYGGESQRREIGYSVFAKCGSLKVEARSTTSFDMDRGKVSKTVYLFSTKAFDSDISLEIPLYRPFDGKCYIADARLSLTEGKAELEMTGGRTHLSFTWEYRMDDCTVRFQLDQDRLVTASVRFLGL